MTQLTRDDCLNYAAAYVRQWFEYHLNTTDLEMYLHYYKMRYNEQ